MIWCLGECADTGDPFLQKHPESEVAEACNLIIEKIVGGNKANLSEDKSVYHDLKKNTINESF